MRDDEERTPLRTILTNFVNHIENLETNRIEDSYEKEFQDLKFFSEILKTLKQHSCSEGEKEVNRKKNRYKDILPFDTSRVILGEYAGVPGSDYINANFIKGASGSPAYIASQGPLPHTVNDFWRMVVECEVQVIVMACNQEEAGKYKCENYWVEAEGEEKQFGMVTIRLLKASIVCPDFMVRTMLLKYTNSRSITEERTVCQFHYSAWPDHGVPPLVRPLLDMVRLVRDTQASETLPVLVHCSAGCGRTGTICAIDYVFGLLRAGKLTKDFSLYALVRDMRRQRIAMVQTKEQYVLVHQAVRELFSEQLRIIDSHPYENIDADGMPLVKEPLYATVNGGNDIVEKQDEKEKDAPPLPDKKKPSSKHAKEVENLTEKQRCAIDVPSSDSESSLSSGMSSLLSRPRISKLKALFERNSSPREGRSRRGNRPVARSHSLGPVRPEDSHRPIPGRGILRVPQLVSPVQKPALPVKRSKSLKVLGTGEGSKLTVLRTDTREVLGNSAVAEKPLKVSSSEVKVSSPPSQSYAAWRNYENIGTLRRRHSLESVILEEVNPPTELDSDARKLLQDCREYLQESEIESARHLSLEARRRMDMIVAGLGVRERRDSFRQAVGKTARVQDYESIWPGPRGPTTMEALRSRQEHATSSTPSTSTINGLDPKSRNLADELAGFYRKPDEFRIAHTKFLPKSLMQKSGGSLRIKGSQALTYVMGSELDDTSMPQNLNRERLKQPLQLSRSNPWPRLNRTVPNTKHSDSRTERPFQDTTKRLRGTEGSAIGLQPAVDNLPHIDTNSVLRNNNTKPSELTALQHQNVRTVPTRVASRQPHIRLGNPGSSVNHLKYADVQSPARRIEGASESKVMPSSSRSSLEADSHPNNVGRPFPDQHLYVNRLSDTGKMNATFHKPLFNGVAPEGSPIKRFDENVKSPSYSAFQDPRGSAMRSPGHARSPPNINQVRQKPDTSDQSKRNVPRRGLSRHEQMDARSFTAPSSLKPEPVSYGLMAGMASRSAPGDVDLDAVAASIQTKRPPVVDAASPRNRALEVMYLRKGSHSENQGSHMPPGISRQPQSPPVKKQQYL